MSTYYGKGSKEEIFSDLYSVINNVTGIQYVDYQRDDPGVKKDNYPGVFINDIETSKTYLLQDIVKNELIIAVVCFVWAEEDEDLITVLNTFAESVKDAIMADPTRGNKAYNTRLDDVITDAGSNWPQAVLAMRVIVTYFSSE